MNLSIYVADLAAYNAGTLRGSWLEVANLCAEEIHDKIQELLKKWGAEEFAIHDYEGFPSFFGEYPDFNDIEIYTCACAQYGKTVVDAFLQLQCLGDIDLIECMYIGAYESRADYIDEYLEQSGYFKTIDNCLKPYLDLEAFARDMELGGDVSSVYMGNKYHYFRNY